MGAVARSWTVDQARDLDQVAMLWRKLGHSARSILAYRQWTLQVLAAAHISNYQELSADKVVRLALSFARRHQHRSPQHTRWRWLSAFRAFAWGLQQLGKPVGSVSLTPKARAFDPVMVAFADYGERLGWSRQTIRSSTQRGLFASVPDPAAGTLARAAVDRSGSFSPPSSQEVEEDYGRRNGWCMPGLAAFSICHWAKRS